MSQNICPITTEIIQKPHTLKCSHVFEKDAILKWLEEHETCPVCREKVKDLEISEEALNSIDNICINNLLRLTYSNRTIRVSTEDANENLDQESLLRLTESALLILANLRERLRERLRE